MEPDAGWDDEFEPCTPTVVVSKKTCRPQKGDVYIGRPSVWGNPFVIGRDGDRAAVIAHYERYIRARLDKELTLRQQLAELRGARLVCWCAPLACHGHVLVRLIESGEYDD